MNSHFARNNRFTNTIQKYFDDKNLKVLWEAPNTSIQPVDYTHMFISEKISSFSTIDHFVSNSRVVESITDAGVHHSALNPSNHSPIYAKIDVGHLKTEVEECHSTKRTSWAKASEEAKAGYSETVANKLTNLLIPECISCTNLHCNDQDHVHQIENYTLDVLEAVEAAARETLPTVGGGPGLKTSGTKQQGGNVPGWNEHVKPFYARSGTAFGYLLASL